MPSDPTRHTETGAVFGASGPVAIGTFRPWPGTRHRQAGAVVGHDPARAEHRQRAHRRVERRAVEREDRAAGVELQRVAHVRAGVAPRARRCPAATRLPGHVRRRRRVRHVLERIVVPSSRSGPPLGEMSPWLPLVHTFTSSRSGRTGRSGAAASCSICVLRYPLGAGGVVTARRAGCRRRSWSGGRRSSTTPRSGGRRGVGAHHPQLLVDRRRPGRGLVRPAPRG